MSASQLNLGLIAGGNNGPVHTAHAYDSARPIGAQESSHGWSEVANATEAEPVDESRVNSRPGGAEENRGRHSHVVLQRPCRGWLVSPDGYHGFRPPTATSTRGYKPSPHSGLTAVRDA